MIGKGNGSTGRKLGQYHFVYHKSHMNWPGHESGLPQWKASHYQPEPWHSLRNVQSYHAHDEKAGSNSGLDLSSAGKPKLSLYWIDTASGHEDVHENGGIAPPILTSPLGRVECMASRLCHIRRSMRSWIGASSSWGGIPCARRSVIAIPVPSNPEPSLTPLSVNTLCIYHLQTSYRLNPNYMRPARKESRKAMSYKN
jgi:hypothetical protein